MIDVIIGPVALRVSGGWIAVLSGNVWLPGKFRLPSSALKYGREQERLRGEVEK